MNHYLDQDKDKVLFFDAQLDSEMNELTNYKLID